MNKILKEMLLQHKQITEENSDIDDIWGETVADGAEDFEEIPEEVEDAEEVVDEDQSEEVDEDVPAEEDKHTVANAIEEGFWTPFLRLKMGHRNNRIEANTKKLNKNIDKLEKTKEEWGNNPLGKDIINKLKNKVDKTATKLDTHTNEYKRAHDERYEKMAKKILYKPGEIQKIIRDPRKLKKVSNPSMFAAQVENMAKFDREATGRLAKATSENRDEAAVQAKQIGRAHV